MANALKGSVSFDALGEKFTLKYDFNLLCDLEEEHPDLMDGKFDVAKFKSPKYIRDMLAKGLAEHHPSLPIATSGKIVTDLGLQGAMTEISRAIMAAFGVNADGTAVLPPGDDAKN